MEFEGEDKVGAVVVVGQERKGFADQEWITSHRPSICKGGRHGW